MIDEDLLEAGISHETVTLTRRNDMGEIKIAPIGVYKMASMGFSLRDISETFGVCEKTLKNHFSDALERGKASIAPRLKVNLLRQALAYEKPNPQLLMFALKNFAGMSDVTSVEAKGMEGVEFKVKFPPKPETKTDD